MCRCKLCKLSRDEAAAKQRIIYHLFKFPQRLKWLHHQPLSDGGADRVSEIKRRCLFIARVINTGLPRYIYLHKQHK